MKIRGEITPDLSQPLLHRAPRGAPVRRLQRALRRTANLGLAVYGIFGPQVEVAVKNFQQVAGW